MEGWRIFLFGGVKVVSNDSVREERLTRTIQALFAYLLLQRNRTLSRELLADLFWGETGQDRARANLNTALWRLRRALETQGAPAGPYLITTPAEVGFNVNAPCWLDLAVFEEQVEHALHIPAQALQEPDVTQIEAGLQLYTGDLLEGFYDDWAIREREIHRQQYIQGLALLMQYYCLHGLYERSATYGRKILELDPLHEEIYRAMMRNYLAMGKRTLALREYELCCSVLQAELGIPPMLETRILYEQILAQAGAETAAPPPAPTIPTSQADASRQILLQLHQALRMAQSAQEQIAGVIAQLTGSPPSDG